MSYAAPNETRNTGSRKLDEEGASLDAAWWLDSYKDERARRVMDVAGQMYRNLAPDRQDMERNARLYGNLPMAGLSPKFYRNRNVASRSNRLALNVVKSVTDTYVAMVTQDRVKISCVTDDADWGTQERAKLIEQAIEGAFYASDFYPLLTSVAYDSCNFPLGAVHYFVDESDPDDPQPGAERIPPDELLFDSQEAYYGKPQTLGRYRWASRRALMEEYPEHAAELRTAGNQQFEDSTSGDTFGTMRVADLVVCVEMWHLPRNKKSGDGRHVLVCGNVTIVDEAFADLTYPIELLYRQPPQRGLFAQALADELAGIQREINVLLQKIQRSHHLLAAGHWLIERGSDVNTNHMDNQIGSLIHYRGVKPDFIAVQAVAPDVYAHLDRLYQRAFEIIGVSSQAAQGQKPAGLNSGKAQLVYADIQSQRFKPSYEALQHFVLRSARQYLRLMRQIADQKKNYAVKGAPSGTRAAIKWANMNLPDEAFILRLYPTNALADDPEGKMEQVQNLANAGWIGPQDAMRLLDFPDLKAFSDEQNASYNAVKSCIDSIMTDGKYRAPEPYMNLKEAIGMVSNARLILFRKNAPVDRLRMLGRWILQAKFLDAEAAKALAPPPLPPPPPPGGPPPPAMQPPTGPLPGMQPPIAA